MNEKLTATQKRETATQAIAKYCCIIAQIEAIDSTDGSPHWWLFVKDAEELYDKIVTKFSPVKMFP